MIQLPTRVIWTASRADYKGKSETFKGFEFIDQFRPMYRLGEYNLIGFIAKNTLNRYVKILLWHLLTRLGENEYVRDLRLTAQSRPGHGWPFDGRSCRKADKRLSKPAISKYENGLKDARQ